MTFSVIKGHFPYCRPTDVRFLVFVARRAVPLQRKPSCCTHVLTFPFQMSFCLPLVSGHGAQMVPNVPKLLAIRPPIDTSCRLGVPYPAVLAPTMPTYYYRFSQPRDHLQWRLVLGYYD